MPNSEMDTASTEMIFSPPDQHHGGVQRHTVYQKNGIEGGQRPRRLPEGFTAVLPQQPPAPLHGGEPEQHGEHRGKAQPQQRRGGKADGLWVGDLGLGVEQRRQQGTHRHHHGRDGKQKRGLAYGHFRRYPPAQQPEGDQHDGGQERIAVQPEHGAERGAADAQQGDASGSDAGGAPGGAQLFP